MGKFPELENIQEDESDSNHNSEPNEEAHYTSDKEPSDIRSSLSIETSNQLEGLPNLSNLEGQENSQVESHDPQYEHSNDANINNHKHDNAKDENTAEMEDDDDEDMDDSINQDNDDNEDDEEEYLEGHEHDKNGNSST